MGHRAVFTHNDLDGLVSALLARVAMPDADVYFCEYAGLPGLVESQHDRYDEMWFADLSIRDETMFKLLRDSGADVLWFDHHASSEEQSWMVECRIDLSGTRCAADVIKAYLDEQQIEVPTPLLTLNDYAHDQDLWIRELPDSQSFNDILGHMPVQALFDLLNHDLDRVYQWTDSMIEASEATFRARAWSIDLARATSVEGRLENGNRVRAVCCWGSVSEVGDELGDEDTLVVILDLRAIEHGRVKYSFRTGSDHVAANKIAEHLGGGGHPRASGAPLELDILNVLSGEVLRRVMAAAEDCEGDGGCA